MCLYSFSFRRCNSRKRNRNPTIVYEDVEGPASTTPLEQHSMAPPPNRASSASHPYETINYESMLPTMYATQLFLGELPQTTLPPMVVHSHTSSLEDEHTPENQKFNTAGRADQSHHDKEMSRAEGGDDQNHYDTDGYLMPVNQAKSTMRASPFS